MKHVKNVYYLKIEEWTERSTLARCLSNSVLRILIKFHHIGPETIFFKGSMIDSNSFILYNMDIVKAFNIVKLPVYGNGSTFISDSTYLSS